jgi:glycosyltransferase involved in cell wall biosynthesis
MAKICLLTPTQPSINPRIVKEADALAEAGHQVHVLCGHTVQWADESDASLLRNRRWTCAYVGGRPGSARHWWSRARHGAIRRFPQAWKFNPYVAKCALARIAPELQAAAFHFQADLYIAHYVGALVAAGEVARTTGALLAFDSEDFESGYFRYNAGPRPIDRLTEQVEREYLPQCCYITAASPGIAAAQASKYGLRHPTSILNVFPVADRPLQFRETSSAGPLKLYWFSQTIGADRGLEDVVRAMAISRDCDMQLYLRGRCAAGYQAQLEALARENGLAPDKLKLCPPALAEHMVSISSEYDVGLALEQPASPNRDLCLTNKIFSYFLAGNAVAATSTSAQEAIVKTLGPAGFVYRPGDYEGLARGLRVWHDNRAELQRARREAWWLGSNRFKWDLEKKKLLDLVDSVLMKQETGSVARSSAIA